MTTTSDSEDSVWRLAVTERFGRDLSDCLVPTTPAVDPPVVPSP
ncbi:hypothetical protein [Halolamina salina]|uniref:Uncharacterized protein n=1 Tax=Halolamina salina TaxID=1220023 RepID=A0ABD6B772_9EURY